LVAFVLLFRKQIEVLLGGGVTIEWEKLRVALGKKIEEAKQEVKEEVAQNLDTVRDELDSQKQPSSPAPSTIPPPTRGAPSPPIAPSSPITPLDRMKLPLKDPRYRWRSVERLSHLAGVPEADTLNVLRDNPDIVLGMGKSGREIARLKSR
jgi:hypothetical protein